MEFELTGDDFKESVKLRASKSASPLLVGSTVVISFVALLIFGINFANGREAVSVGSGSSYYYLIIPFAVCLFFYHFYKAKRNFAKAVQGKLIFYRFDEEYAHWSSPDGEGKTKLETYSHWVRGEKIYLLEQVNNLAYILPKRGLPKQEHAAFEQFLTDKLGPPKRR